MIIFLNTLTDNRPTSMKHLPSGIYVTAIGDGIDYIIELRAPITGEQTPCGIDKIHMLCVGGPDCDCQAGSRGIALLQTDLMFSSLHAYGKVLWRDYFTALPLGGRLCGIINYLLDNLQIRTGDASDALLARIEISFNMRRLIIEYPSMRYNMQLNSINANLHTTMDAIVIAPPNTMPRIYMFNSVIPIEWY